MLGFVAQYEKAKANVQAAFSANRRSKRALN